MNKTLEVFINGEKISLNSDNTGFDIFKNKSVVAQKINGRLYDMPRSLGDIFGSNMPNEIIIEPVDIASEDGLNIMRHSCAHVLAQAVQQLYPGTKLSIGPYIKDGFYYDFDAKEPFCAEDFKKIENLMQKIINSGQTFKRRVVSKENALKELKDEPYKLALINSSFENPNDLGDESKEIGPEITIYDNIDTNTGNVQWCDLCRGPHLPSTRFIKAFKLLRVSGAYFRGDEKNPQLQRIYGTAFASKEDLHNYLHKLEEAKKRDHRLLGQKLDLFSFPKEIGSGLAVFHPKGAIIKNLMEEFSKKEHIKAGYSFVSTPHITKSNLFEISGHLKWYEEGMFAPIDIDGSLYYLKPMNCPMHNIIYNSSPKSYRDLPLRLFEMGTVYRYEKSGVVQGLTRSRGFTQDDAHIYCTEEDLYDELIKVLDFILYILRSFGLENFYLELSTKDEKKFVGSDEIWQKATEILKNAAEKSNLKLVLDKGGAAFYGPKISVQAEDALGRSWQMSTVQLDFNLPKRFNLQYSSKDGSLKTPIMIHRALFGSVERFFAVLLEHFAGAFPLWLSPIQIQMIPVRDENLSYLTKIRDVLTQHGLRSDIDKSDNRFAKKIRSAASEKIPLILIAGDTDESQNTISLRFRDGSLLNEIKLEAILPAVLNAIDNKLNINSSKDLDMIN